MMLQDDFSTFMVRICFASFWIGCLTSCGLEKSRTNYRSDVEELHPDDELVALWSRERDAVKFALTDSASPQSALKILEERCFSCHGSAQVAMGGIGNITDTQSLIDSGKIIPSDPDKSPLLLRMLDTARPMPPRPAPSATPEEIAIIKQWIIQLGVANPAPPETQAPTNNPSLPIPNPLPTQEIPPTANPPPPPTNQERRFTSLREEFNIVQGDLRLLRERRSQAVRNVRYFSLVPLYNSGVSDAKIKEHANSLSRIINHLSRRPQLVKPVAINIEKTIFRIDLSSYGWRSQEWERLVREYPYKNLFPESSLRKEFESITGESTILVRADWFALHATQPQNYYMFLNTPSNLSGAERDFGFDISSRIRTQGERGGNLVMRSGFLKSGVSLSNRMFERHAVSTGGFWLSYDFEKIDLKNTNQSVLRKNIFASPLGPKGSFGPNNRGRDDFAFEHSAGEIIAHLPNGLFWYMLIDGNGRRINVAPTQIVVDPSRPEGIANGFSCMNCHAQGLLKKDDEIRPHLPYIQGLNSKEKSALLNLYPPKETMTRAIESDNKRYLDAVKAVSIYPEVPSPSILSLAQSYESYVTASIVASELGISVQDLKNLIQNRVSRDTQNQLSQLLKDGGLLSRNLYEPLVEKMLREILARESFRR